MPTTTYGPTTTAAEIVANVDLDGRRAPLKVLGRRRTVSVHKHLKVRVRGKQGHLTGGIPSISAVRIGVDQLADCQPVG